MKRITTEEFIIKAKITHNEKYDYSVSTYTTARDKIKILCHKHGIFHQKPHDHLYGRGCKKCVGLNSKTNSEFIEESIKLFGDRFEYGKINYISSQRHLTLICKKHGEFKVTPNNHLSKKQGCPICRESKGEKKISEVLDEMGIQYKREKTFNDCIGKKRKLPFDFYLPNQNLIIEYDGRHHFEMVDVFGGENGFIEIQRNDKIKNRFLINNNINLIRISYRQYKNINHILHKNLY